MLEHMCNAWNHPADCQCGFGGEYHGSIVDSQFRRYESNECFSFPCRYCGEVIFLYKNDRGSVVLFDSLGIPWPKHSCHDFTMNNASSSYEFYFVSKDYDIDYYSKKHLIIRSSHKTVEETIDRLAHKIASRLLFKLLKDERTKKYFSTIIMGIAPSELLSLKVLYSSPLMNFHVVEAHIGGRFHVQNGTVERKRIVHFIFNIDKRYYVICNSESASLLIKHIKQKIDWQLNSATYFQNLHGQKQLAQSRTSQKDSVARENVIKQLIKRYRSFINLQTLSEREIINIIEWLYDNDPDRFRNWAMKNKSSSFKFKSVVIEYVRKIYPK